MKKIKKIVLRPGQELGLQEQQLVVAGGDWRSEGCFCTNSGHCHREYKKEKVSDIDWPKVVQGSLVAAAGIFAIGASGVFTLASAGATTPAAVSGVLGGAAAVLDGTSSVAEGFSSTKTITYRRLQHYTGYGPTRHSPGEPWIDE